MTDEAQSMVYKVKLELTRYSSKLELEGDKQWVTDQFDKALNKIVHRPSQLPESIPLSKEEDTFEQLPLFANAKSDTPPADQSKRVPPQQASNNGTSNDEDVPPDLCTFYQKIARDTHREQILIIAYYKRKYENQTEITVADLSAAYEALMAGGVPIFGPQSKHMTTRIKGNIQQAFMRKGSGNSYVLTRSGWDEVEKWLKGDE